MATGFCAVGILQIATDEPTALKAMPWLPSPNINPAVEACMVGELVDPAPEETTTKRPLGVTLIAAFFFLKGAALLLALGMWQMSRAMLPTAKALAIVAAPVTAQFGLKNVMMVAAVIAVWELTFGLGIWFLARWAWGYTIIMYAAGAVALILVLLAGYADPSFLSLIPHSGYFPVHFVIRIVILAYLLRPNVKVAFGGNREVGAGDLVL